MAFVRLVEPGGHGPRRVLLVADVGEPLRHLPPVRPGLLEDLVPDAPHHDARVVPVAPDHVPQVALAPRVEVLPVAVLDLRHAPHVEGLVHDEQAHAVRRLEQLGGRRVVARADGVRPHALQDLELALRRAAIDGGPERAQVVVVAHALQRDAAAVQQEALVGAVLDRADAERRLVTVEDGVATPHRADHGVEVGPVQVPARGRRDRDPGESGRRPRPRARSAPTGCARPRGRRRPGSASRA